MANLMEETIVAINNSGHRLEDVDYSFIHNEKHSYYNEHKYTEYSKGFLAIKSLDFVYDNGYGGQEIFGFIVFKDGSWLERAEYDGSEWWEYKTKPKLP